MHGFAFDIDTLFSFLPSDIGSLETITLTETFTPTLSGAWKILVSLDCQQLRQVHGVAEVLVKEKWMHKSLW